VDDSVGYIWTPGKLARQSVPSPRETILCIQVNGQELVKLAVSPVQQEALVTGFLYHAGLIRDTSDIRVLRFHPDRPCADVWLNHNPDRLSRTPFLTSGCGGGIVLGDLYTPPVPLKSTLRLSPEALVAMMHALQMHMGLYRQSRGVHTSALFAPDGEMLALAEDIGRHNTIDKLLGLCLLQKIKSDDTLLLTTGRVSSEMLSKAALLRSPIIGSLTAFTTQARALAEMWHITAVGYVRQQRMTIYAHPERLASGLALEEPRGLDTHDHLPKEEHLADLVTA